MKLAPEMGGFELFVGWEQSAVVMVWNEDNAQM
jgi:hypothetical protein